MRATILASAAVIALATTIGSVLAADQFTTLNGVRVVPMSPAEMNAVKGKDGEFFRILPPGDGNYPQDSKGRLDPPTSAPPLDNGSRIETDHYQSDNGQGNFITVILPLDGGGTKEFTVSPSYLGLSQAGCNGVIVFPYAGTQNYFCE